MDEEKKIEVALEVLKNPTKRSYIFNELRYENGFEKALQEGLKTINDNEIINIKVELKNGKELYVGADNELSKKVISILQRSLELDELDKEI